MSGDMGRSSDEEFQGQTADAARMSFVASAQAMASKAAQLEQGVRRVRAVRDGGRPGHRGARGAGPERRRPAAHPAQHPSRLDRARRRTRPEQLRHRERRLLGPLPRRRTAGHRRDHRPRPDAHRVGRGVQEHPRRARPGRPRWAAGAAERRRRRRAAAGPRPPQAVAAAADPGFDPANGGGGGRRTATATAAGATAAAAAAADRRRRRGPTSRAGPARDRAPVPGDPTGPTGPAGPFTPTTPGPGIGRCRRRPPDGAGGSGGPAAGGGIAAGLGAGAAGGLAGGVAGGLALPPGSVAGTGGAGSGWRTRDRRGWPARCRLVGPRPRQRHRRGRQRRRDGNPRQRTRGTRGGRPSGFRRAWLRPRPGWAGSAGLARRARAARARARAPAADPGAARTGRGDQRTPSCSTTARTGSTTTALSKDSSTDMTGLRSRLFRDLAYTP